jgi:DNA-directed RNA polymerase specialized sigma24 family protein
MLQKFQQGDTEIVDQLIERLYEDPEFKKLMHCAYRKLGVRGKRTEDEEGVMQEAMAQLYLKAKSKNLEGVDNRHRLFGLLRLIVAERARAHRRKGSAKKNGGDINVMSLNEPIVAGDDVDRHAQISDPESAAPQERTDMIDFVRQLLERCREKFPNEVFLGKLIEALFDGRNMNQIAEHTEGTRSQVTAAIDAIRSIAREIGGSEWKSLKVEFEM